MTHRFLFCSILQAQALTLTLALALALTLALARPLALVTPALDVALVLPLQDTRNPLVASIENGMEARYQAL